MCALLPTHAATFLLLLGPAILLAGPAAPGPRALAAQGVVDEGVFLISRGGEAVGTEQFAIRRTSASAGGRLIATAEVELELSGSSRRISSALEFRPEGLGVTAYQVKVSGDRRQEIYMTLSNRRFQAKVVTGQGEEVREYRAGPGSVVLEEGIAHHYHFLVARLEGAEARVPVVVPRIGEQKVALVRRIEGQRVQIAGRDVQARHLQVELDGSTRDLWVDDQGRVLRVVNPETGYRAERRDLPG